MNRMEPGTLWSNRTRDGKLFKNMGGTEKFRTSLGDLLRWRWQRLRGHEPTPTKAQYAAFYAEWYNSDGVDFAASLAQLHRGNERRALQLQQQPGGAAATAGAASALEEDSGEGGIVDRVYWLGHASQLLCVANRNHPSLSKDASAFTAGQNGKDANWEKDAAKAEAGGGGGAAASHDSRSGQQPLFFNILFDPIFSKRCSPLSFAGPARRYPSPVSAAPPHDRPNSLPPIHAVCVSHDHYDHLDKASVVAVYRRNPRVLFVLPLNFEGLLAAWGIPAANMVLLDWWEERALRFDVSRQALVPERTSLAYSHDDVDNNDTTGKKKGAGEEDRLRLVVSCAPAQHWGRHGMCDTSKRLWCGWVWGWNPGGGGSGAAAGPHSTTEKSTADTAGSGAGFSPTSNGNEKKKNDANNEKNGGNDDEDDGLPRFPTAVPWASTKNYYFTGDTTYNEAMFRMIARHYQHHLRLSALPIGAYSPRWFMSSQHTDPEHAAVIFRILHYGGGGLADACRGAGESGGGTGGGGGDRKNNNGNNNNTASAKPRYGQAFAVHWATFELADEPIYEPPHVLRDAMRYEGIAPDDFRLIRVGDYLDF